LNEKSFLSFLSVLIVHLYQDIDEVAGKISISIAPTLLWVDEKLKWDPNSYSGIDTLVLPLEDIWFPKLDLLNPYTNTKIHTKDDTARVDANGQVFLGTVVILETTCFINVQYYPFDTQVRENT